MKGHATRRWLLTSVQRGLAAFERHFDGGFAPESDRRGAVGISVTNLTLSYNAIPALDGVTAAFPPGSLTAIVGPNGAGKSSLLKAIAGILQPRVGRIAYDGAWPRDLAYLPQSDAVDRSFPITIGEFVALGRWRDYGAFRPAPTALGDAVRQALDAVGLAEIEARPIAMLSVGQFRRVLFARMLLQRAPLLLLDEPFAAVDATTTNDLLRLVAHWHGEGATIIAVLHDLDQVRRHFPRAVLLARRCIAAGETAEILTAENLAAAGFGEAGS